MSELNNAVLAPFGGYLPVYDIEVVDAKQKIWRGTMIPHESRSMGKVPDDKIIFFTRAYNPEVNDMDLVYPEIEFKSKAIKGVKFWLIPKDKILFGYEEPTAIARVTPGTIKIGRGLN